MEGSVSPPAHRRSGTCSNCKGSPPAGFGCVDRLPGLHCLIVTDISIVFRRYPEPMWLRYRTALQRPSKTAKAAAVTSLLAIGPDGHSGGHATVRPSPTLDRRLREALVRAAQLRPARLVR